MDRYIVRQLSLLFLFSTSLLSSLGVAIGTVSDLAYKITEYQLPIPVAVLIFCYKIPEYAAYALPISILLTGLIIYGRLNSDRELTALFSFGISFYRIVLPALIFSLVVTGITFLLNELIVPAANYQANLLQNPFIAETELNLQKQDIFYAEYELMGNNTAKKLKHIYFAEQYDRQRLLKVTIIDFRSDRVWQIITARSAQWNQQQQVWDLVAGEIKRFNRRAKENISEEFTTKQLPFPKTIFEIVNKERSPEDMNIHQAKEYLNLIKDSGNPTDIGKFAVRIQQKYAFPFICVVFALVGSALGAKYSQINRSKSFGLCVGIVFTYYCLGFAIGSLGITGVISPFWAAWLPNLIGLIVGVYLLATANN
ncbi:MAG TPA: LptF/LptG family permease [Coleofasciculaceae cyanobacterium]|jgi:lipopolysaccharide export system permease protein